MRTLRHPCWKKLAAVIAWVAASVTPALAAETLSDAFASRPVASGSSATFTGDSTSAGAETGEPEHAAGGTRRHTLWGAWTAPDSGTVSIKTAGSSFDTVLAVYAGAALSQLLPVAQNNDGQSGVTWSSVAFPTKAGVTYSFVVDGRANSATFQGNVLVDVSFSAAAQAGAEVGTDSFAARPVLPSGSQAIGVCDTRLASEELNEPARVGGSRRSVWWRWVAPANGAVTIDTLGSSFDTVLKVYVGDTLPALSSVAINNDAPGSVQSRLTFQTLEGQEYQVMLTGAADASSGHGNAILHLAFEPNSEPGGVPGFDNFARRGLLSGLRARGVANNSLFTRETGEPNHGFGRTQSTWWQWTAPTNGWVSISTEGSDPTTFLAVYGGTSYADLQLVTNRSVAGNVSYSAVVFRALRRVNYHIMVDGSGLGNIAFVLTQRPDDDAPRPVLKLTSPTAGQGVAGTKVKFSGRASDTFRVARVEVTINGGAPQVLANTGTPDNFAWTFETVPENGPGRVVVTAYDEFNLPSLSVARTFTFLHLRPGIAGSFLGLLQPTPGSPTPVDHEGLVKISVGRAGAFTGWVKLGGATLAVKGLVFNDGSLRFGRREPIYDLIRKARSGGTLLGRIELAADLGANADRITGTLTLGAAVVADLARADRALYTSKKNPVAPYRNVPTSLANPLGNKGNYTALFYHAAAPNNGLAAGRYPQGEGWAKSTIAASGNVTVAGRLADGTVVSYGGSLSKANELPVYVPLYVARRGFLLGRVAFDPGQTETDASAVGMKWFKPINPADALYPLGWPDGITVDFAASKFVVPAKPTRTNQNPLYVSGRDNILGLPAPTRVTLVLADGGIPPAADISKVANVDGKNKVTLAAPPDAELNLKATLASGSGRLTGSFKHPVGKKTVPFSGVVFQKMHTAGGCFLYHPPKQPGKPAPDGLSGSVGVAPEESR
jgi:hypothetical protein